MIEQALLTEPTATANGGEPNGAAPKAAELLEQRVFRLEQAVAALQEAAPVEDRIVEKVTERLNGSAAPQESSNLVMEAGRRLLPTALGIVGGQTHADPEPPKAPKQAHKSWLLHEAYLEARTMLEMYTNSRYRQQMTWTSRVMPLVLLVAIFTTSFWLPVPAIVSGPVGTLVDLVLAFILFKILNREAQRYKKMSG